MDERGPRDPRERSGSDDDGCGLSMVDLLELPAPQRRLLNWMIREREVGQTELAGFAAGDEDGVASTLAALVERGLVQLSGDKRGARYRVVLASRSTRPRARALEVVGCLRSQGR
ncbi:MAG: hypothetical protein ACYC5J_20310 [Chloroflexota bacterium]